MEGLIRLIKRCLLVKKLLELGSDQDSICLDFFSGSGTLADSIFRLNVINGCRKFIAVQLPEDLDVKLNNASASDKAKIQKIISFLQENGYPHTLDYIGIERIKRAAKKIREENPIFAGDLGFKHYILEEPKEDMLLKLDAFNPSDELLSDITANDFGVETVLRTWLEADGYGLTEDAEELSLSNYKAYYKGDHLYFINPEDDFSAESIAALMDKYNAEAFSPKNIVIFGYSFGFTHREELQKNLRALKDGNKSLTVNIDIRY